jgi:hypothetical protein
MRLSSMFSCDSCTYRMPRLMCDWIRTFRLSLSLHHRALQFLPNLNGNCAGSWVYGFLYGMRLNMAMFFCLCTCRRLGMIACSKFFFIVSLIVNMTRYWQTQPVRMLRYRLSGVILLAWLLYGGFLLYTEASRCSIGAPKLWQRALKTLALQAIGAVLSLPIAIIVVSFSISFRREEC